MKINLDTVRERDIDLLLIRLLHSNKLARDYVLKTLELDDAEILDAYHSIMNEHGESDIILLCKLGNKTISVHIENKIDASAQPNQYERYKQRCEDSKKKEDCNDYKICIFCPDKYFLNNTEAKKYPYHLSYEGLLKVIDTKHGNKFDIELLNKGIDKSHHKVASKSEKMTAFWTAFYDYIDNYNFMYRGLKYNTQTDYGPRTFWRDFQTSIQGVRIIYKADQGCIDIEFSSHKDEDHQIESFICHIFPEFVIKRAEQSISISAKVDKVDFNKTFDEQKYLFDKIIDQIWKMKIVVDKLKAEGIQNLL